MLLQLLNLHQNKNKKEIQKLLSKRDQIVIDVTTNGKHIENFQKQLKKITFEIEYLYHMGVAK